MELAEAIDRLEHAIRAAHPDVDRIFIEADLLSSAATAQGQHEGPNTTDR